MIKLEDEEDEEEADTSFSETYDGISAVACEVGLFHYFFIDWVEFNVP